MMFVKERNTIIRKIGNDEKLKKKFLNVVEISGFFEGDRNNFQDIVNLIYNDTSDNDSLNINNFCGIMYLTYRYL